MKKLKRYIFIGAGLLALVALGSSCKKQLDINQSPNFPAFDQGTPSIVFPVGVLGTTGKVGGDLAIVGGMWSQHFTQAALAQQYTNIDSYNMPGTDGTVDSIWATMFIKGLNNYQYVISRSDSSKDWTYFLMGTVMKAYTTGVLVDLYDKVPYSEGLLGAGNLNPKFDDGYAVYQSLITSLDAALGKDFTASTNTSPGSQDPVFGGDVSSWIAFANTLKLKFYLRMVNAHPDVAQSGVQKLLSSGVPFLTTDAAFTNFTDNPFQDNPLYEQNIRQLNTAGNLRASVTFTSWLENNNDPRIKDFFGSSNPVAINQGDYRSGDPTYPNAATWVETPIDPVEFISAAESYFLQAEADVRYNGGANAKGLYESGVTAAFSAVGENAAPFIGAGGKYEWGNEIEGGQPLGQIEQIIRQKWASCAYGCHGIESYFDFVRTGFPKQSTVYSTSGTYIPGQLVVSKNSVLPAGQLPKRLPYPYNETSRNTNAPQTIVPIGTPVWWGK
jgi:hypothetical protein